VSEHLQNRKNTIERTLAHRKKYISTREETVRK